MFYFVRIIIVNLCIDEIKEKNVRDCLEHMYRAYDQIYSHFRNLGRLFSLGASSSGGDTLQLMWGNLEYYNIDSVLSAGGEGKLVLGW